MQVRKYEMKRRKKEEIKKERRRRWEYGTGKTKRSFFTKKKKKTHLTEDKTSLWVCKKAFFNMNKFISVKKLIPCVRKLNNKSALLVIKQQQHVCFTSYKLHEGSSQLKLILTRTMREVLSVISRWLISMLRPPPPLPNYGNKTSGDSGGIYWCLLFYENLSFKARLHPERSNEILSYQIEFFAWLISVRGRCCTHTRRISKHFSGFHLPRVDGTEPLEKNKQKNPQV